MANIVLGGSTVITETDGVATIPNDVIGGQGLFNGPDTSASLLQNISMTKNTALPVFAIRAYGFFDGTQTSTVGSETHCQLQSCGNISKVVRTSAAKYTVYFETPMPDNKYIVTGSANPNDYTGCYFGIDYAASTGKLSYLTDRFAINTRDTNNSTTESNYITFIVVR